MKRFNSDPSSVPLSRDLVTAMKNSHKVYSERLQRESEEQERQKRRTSSVANQPVAEKKLKLCEEKYTIEKRLVSSKAMLERAQSLIKAGLG